jgi:predicted alpha/beta hydrolase
MRRRAWWLWFVVSPAALALCGYFPGRRLRIVGDLPANVMRQWRRWCLNAEYAMGAEGAREQYAAVRTPLASLSFHDDEFMSARNTESLLGFYANAPKAVKRLRPEDAGVARIGHFGFFRAAFERSLWRGLLLPELASRSVR